jgi:alkanesulfonate monooxygenase SsuD/methylene tetrahydromethanopterin reductase-like flavin-dependent oxidoreductase (luciferase family)
MTAGAESAAGPLPARVVMILSENATLWPERDLNALVRAAAEAEQAGVDAVMFSEHVVLAPGSDAEGRPSNPRQYALMGNQDPTTSWPNSLVMLSAIAAVTSRVRLVAAAVIAPLRHPLLLAKELATLDLLSGGRLVVQPTVSWFRPEYEALGVPWAARGDLLDVHLAAWEALWAPGPASFDGGHYPFADVFLEPKPFGPRGPTIWLGGSTLHDRLLRRLVRYADAFHPLGQPTDDELARLGHAMTAAGKDIHALEMVGGMRAVFPDDASPADVGRALESVPPQLERGFRTFCFKPSQFTDDPAEVGAVSRAFVDGVESLAG